MSIPEPTDTHTVEPVPLSAAVEELLAHLLMREAQA